MPLAEAMSAAGSSVPAFKAEQLEGMAIANEYKWVVLCGVIVLFLILVVVWLYTKYNKAMEERQAILQDNSLYREQIAAAQQAAYARMHGGVMPQPPAPQIQSPPPATKAITAPAPSSTVSDEDLAKLKEKVAREEQAAADEEKAEAAKKAAAVQQPITIAAPAPAPIVAAQAPIVAPIVATPAPIAAAIVGKSPQETIRESERQYLSV